MQPSNEWSIQRLNADGSAASAPQALAALGIESATYDLNNMAADTLTFSVGGREVDAAALWPFGTLLALLRPDGQRFFFGRVEPWNRDGRNENQNHFGRLVNPWWYLANKIYEQRYTVTSFANIVAVGQPQTPIITVTHTPRVVLNVLYNAAAGAGFYSCNTGAQIADAVGWAIANGAPMALGVTDPNTFPFSDFQKGIRCSDVIINQFRKEPDFVMDWDYSTLPFPTVHFRKAASLVPVTIDLNEASVRERVRIQERPDWQRSYVRVAYDQTFTQDGASYLSITQDVWPNPPPTDIESQFRGVDLYCDLSGASATSSTQVASFASLGFDIKSVDTWKRWKADLSNKDILSVMILVDGNPLGLSAPALQANDELDAQGLPALYNYDNAYELIEGQWADWINGISAQRVRATAVALVIKDNGPLVPPSSSIVECSHDFTAISKDTGGQSQRFTLRTNNYSQYAEPIPVGLAKAMWTSWQNLAIEGSITNVAAVVSKAISRSHCLNFLTTAPGVNGRPDWRNVKALVQRIHGDLATGAVTVDFGAPLHITGHELIDAVRATRYRVATIDLGALFGGALGGGGNASVSLGRKTHAHSGGAGVPHAQVQTISAVPKPGATDPHVHTDGNTGVTYWVGPGGGKTCVCDPADCMGSDGKLHAVRFQEQKVCVKIGGVLKQRTLIAWTSDAYQAPDDPA